MAEKQKDYFSSREAAKLLGVAVSTIQLWVNNGHLKAWTTSGGHRRISRSSVESILKEQNEILDCHNEERALTVVIVDDDASQLRLYQKYLLTLDLDVTVITAQDGYEGLVKIGNTNPDIIITDLVMPNMDGFKMVRALTELTEVTELTDCEIIAATGLTENEVKEKGGLPQGVHLLTKPIKFEDLEPLIINSQA